VSIKILTLILFTAISLRSQTNNLTGTPAAIKVETNLPPSSAGQRAEKIRAECLQGRRIICGKILKILPGGLVVDSGYTDLLRPPLNKSWLISGSVTASRPANLVEGHEPESICIGVIYLTAIPKSRGSGNKPRQYDYVSLLAYPAGEFTYTSVGTVHKTVRRFSADLLKAVNLNLEIADKSRGAAVVGTK
jgi:hypothetical protein